MDYGKEIISCGSLRKIEDRFNRLLKFIVYLPEGLIQKTFGHVKGESIKFNIIRSQNLREVERVC